MLQEALISHGCSKAEAAAAEQLYARILQDMQDDRCFVNQRPELLHKSSATASVTAVSKTASGTSSAAAATSQNGADVSTGSAAASVGAVSARDTGAAPRGVAAATAAATAAAAAAASQPVPTSRLMDYDVFAQLWLSDLTAAISK